MLDLPRAFKAMPDYSNLYINRKKMKTKSGCLLGFRIKQTELELCTSSSESAIVMTF